MKILAIETSCDETSAAVVEDGTEILSNIVATQVDFHRKYGGIVPEIASRKHIEVISPIIQQALDKAELKFSDLNAVAVTYGPGLVGSLLVGICAAKALAYTLKIPLIGVNHLEGHIYANFLKYEIRNTKYEIKFPFVCLIVSGGHTSLVLVKDHGQYQTLGQTRDDAAGEAFDKIARFLNLGYPGGPIIDELAKSGNPQAVDFPRAMLEEEYGYDFSFSGIKTAVVYYLKKCPMSNAQCPMPNVQCPMSDLVASFQQAVVDVLVAKSIKAARDLKVNTIALAGGVACNSLLRNELESQGKKGGIEILFPPPQLCTDNAAMIGSAAYFKFRKNGRESDWNLKAVSNAEL